MVEASQRRRLQENWQSVVQSVADAARAAGRPANAIRIVGVSKYVDAEMTAALADVGCQDLGESRPQRLWEKAESGVIATPVRWHLIGHLQRNKIRRLLRHRPMIHSIDSERLLTAVARESASEDRAARVLLEVNISGDDAKTGLPVNSLLELLQRIPQHGVRVEGLMAMAGWGTDPEEARRHFAATRQLRDRLARDSGLPLPELSMGMSGDFVQAIAEGATIVRVGSRLFEGIVRHE